MNERIEATMKVMETPMHAWMIEGFHKRRKKARSTYSKGYQKKRRAEDPAFAVLIRLRGRMVSAVRGTAKAGTTRNLVGCSPAELKAWIEGQFTEGMTWDNRDQWHIDHKRPCAVFDLTDPEQQRACFHYTNLQPLWASDNMRKGGR